MTHAAEKLMEVTRARRPDLYEAILRKTRPHGMKSVLKVLGRHLANVPDLNLFNERIDRVPEFVWSVVKHMKMPVPGDAFGINVVCRVTKSDTQGTLDSKHLQGVGDDRNSNFDAERDVLEELALFSNHMQIFELAKRHEYATVFTSPDTTLEFLSERLPDACVLQRGNAFNKGVSGDGSSGYLQSFRYVLAEDRGSVKILYRSMDDLFALLRRVPLRHVEAFSDVRNLFRKCGVACAFFNTLQVARRQLFANDGSAYETDVATLIAFMFCRGEPLPMNRDGLAKTRDRPALDVLSFEAMKKNCARLATGSGREEWRRVGSSLEKIFVGEQFNEGTGYGFELLPAREVSEAAPRRANVRDSTQPSNGSTDV